jgi:hypothetical protein
MKGKPQNKNCPVCGLPLDINTYVPGQAGKEPVDVESGDVTFCFSCRTVFVINEALNIVIPDEDELYEITHDEGFYHFVNQVDQARKNKINLN